MNSDIYYKVVFYTYWHCGSGLTAGADLDALTIKSRKGLPFIPGKTMKGLVREAVEDIFCYKQIDRSILADLFGNSEDKNNLINSEITDKMRRGSLFFTNAELNSAEQGLIDKNLSKFLYKTISSTAIDSNGVAKDFSLRQMEVVVPCELYGRIANVPLEVKEDIVLGLRFIKRLGTGRNRGLGRCDIVAINEKEAVL